MVVLQVLLQDVKLRMQILDLVTYMLVVLANMEQVCSSTYIWLLESIFLIIGH